MENLAPDDDAMLDQLQHAAFGYFEQAFNPVNGLVADTSRQGSPCSIAVVGFALSVYPIAVERGWMERTEAVRRSLAALRFFASSDQSGSETATGYRGFYYHFLDMDTGARMWRSELSSIDSALLIVGALLAAGYFDAEVPDEVELRQLADTLYRRADWAWALNGESTIRHGWKPECGFLNYGWDGYDEGIILYILALGSPTFPIDPEHYDAWTFTYQWENLYGHEFLFAGPLFMHQFSHAWIDFRDIQDQFMRQKNCDYFENTRRAVAVQREYAWRNPHWFRGYDKDCWGLTACDGPNEGAVALVQGVQRLYGYAARGVPYGPDDGTVGGWGAIACMPFAPADSLAAARHMLKRYPEMLTQGMYASSFNPTLGGEQAPAWISAGHFGLDQGIVMMMIENYRTDLPWRLMRDCDYLQAGLRRAGYSGGWLQ